MRKLPQTSQAGKGGAGFDSGIAPGLLECAGSLLVVKCWDCHCRLSTNRLVELSDFLKGGAALAKWVTALSFLDLPTPEQ